jgi:hypothetical protein
MSASPSPPVTRHLEHLERFLRQLGTYGTAFVDGDDVLDDTWYGLLVWDIAHGAQSGTTIRCAQDSDGTWTYRYDDGRVIAGVHDRLAVHHALSGKGDDHDVHLHR